MAKIAVDLALIPPKNVMNIAIRINNKEDANSISVLHKEKNLPHITLAMGIINEEDLEKFNLKIENISKNYAPLDLEIDELYSEVTPNKRLHYAFNVKLTPELIKLHEEIMDKLFPTPSNKVTTDMFVNDEEGVEKVSTFWIKNYKKNSNEKKFHAHISLKCSKATSPKLPIKFKASRFALCQLGTYCTCKRKLIEIKLKQESNQQ